MKFYIIFKTPHKKPYGARNVARCQSSLVCCLSVFSCPVLYFPMLSFATCQFGRHQILQTSRRPRAATSLRWGVVEKPGWRIRDSERIDRGQRLENRPRKQGHAQDRREKLHAKRNDKECALATAFFTKSTRLFFVFVFPILFFFLRLSHSRSSFFHYTTNSVHSQFANLEVCVDLGTTKQSIAHLQITRTSLVPCLTKKEKTSTENAI